MSVDEILAAYPDGPCDTDALLALLERGDRKLAQHRTEERGLKPAMLRVFASRCGVNLLEPAFEPSPGVEPGTSIVLLLGSGDAWVCDTGGPDPDVRFVDHEEPEDVARPITTLSQLLAAWLLFEEITRLELDDEELEERFRVLLPEPFGFSELPR